MPVTMIVEDGTGVDDANSFVTVEEYKQYAENNGSALPTSDDALKIQLIKATTSLAQYEPQLAGTRVEPEQALMFPRDNVPVPGSPGYAYTSDTLPPALKVAQMTLALAINAGIEVSAVGGKATGVKRRKIGPIETEYFEGSTVSGEIKDTVPAAYLAIYSLFDRQGFGIRTRRV